MSNNSDYPTWEGTTVFGWLTTALVLFVSFWDLDLVVHNAPFALDFNFTGFLILAAVWLNQSRYFRLSDTHLDIDGHFNAADIPFENITQFNIRHIFFIGYLLTINYEGTTKSQKQRTIFLSHIRRHEDFVKSLLQHLPPYTDQIISERYQTGFLENNTGQSS